jgi:hypothetical protein
MKKLKALESELAEIERELSSAEEDVSIKSDLAIGTRKLIEERRENLRKIAFEKVLKRYDDILNIFPRHEIDPSYAKNIVIDPQTTVNTIHGIETCTDTNPVNVTICDRCAVLHLKNIIETDIANFLMG